MMWLVVTKGRDASREGVSKMMPAGNMILSPSTVAAQAANGNGRGALHQK
jgi:hypothetical protein